MTTAIVTTTTSTEINLATIADFAREWTNYVDVAPSTLKTYNRVMKNFCRWLAENQINTVNRETVISYRDTLLQKLQPTTCRLYIACVKLFIKFLSTKGICVDFSEHIKGVKLDNDTHARDALNVEEAQEVLKTMKGNSEMDLRNKAVIALMLATGLRRIEVVRLDVADIERRGKKLFLKVHGKARQGKQDRVILPSQCAALIIAYLKTRKNVSGNSPLFVSTSPRCKGARLDEQTISRLAKKALVNAGFDSPRLTCHSLRHFFATTAINAGIDVRQVSRALRHKSVIVTEVYLHDIDAANNMATSTVANLIFRKGNIYAA